MIGDHPRVVLDDEVFDLRQFVGDTLVIVCVLLVEPFVLVLDVRADLLHKLIIASQDEPGNLGSRIRGYDGFHQ